MNEKTVRAWTKEDMPFLCGLMNVPAVIASLHTTKTSLADWESAYALCYEDQDEENFILCDSKKPIGWLKINGLDHPDLAWISMLVVLPAEQRRGMGEFAVRFAVDYSRARGFNRVCIHTTEDNKAAQACYTKCGFTIAAKGDCMNGDGKHRMGYKYEKNWKGTRKMNIAKENLVIRNATADDAQQLCTWWNDGTVMAHAGFPKGLGTTAEEVRASIAAEDGQCRCIIERDGVSIGEMSYRDKGNHVAEIGIKICNFSAQNHGCGTKLLTMLITSLFDEYGYEKIILDTNVQNRRAQHVYEKLGFRKLRVNTDAWRDQCGELQSSIDYELTKADWRECE